MLGILLPYWLIDLELCSRRPITRLYYDTLYVCKTGTGLSQFYHGWIWEVED